MNMETKQISLESLREGMTFLVDKPYEWTSFDVVAKLRNTIKKKLNQRKYKVGHAGTLDPLATGLLIICTGRRTKTIFEYQNMKKEYSGIIRLGASTPSFDLETEVDERFPVAHITKERMDQAREQLSGTIVQNVPIYSAVKIDGERMYRKARKGEEVRIKSREVNVFSFDTNVEAFPDIEFRINVSKGTYIRAIANDFGRLVESGGHLAELRRTKIGNYAVENAWSVDELVNVINALGEQKPKMG